MERKFSEGILVGCNKNQEWLLSWWWEHYSKHNSLPVAFADFGLSEKGLAWCQNKGPCFSVPHIQLKKVPQKEKKAWEKRSGDIWPFRASWFQKPLACLSSPFRRTCWIDLDCEIRGPLDPIFNTLQLGAELAIVKEAGAVFNSGVVGFIQKCEVLNCWAKLAEHENDRFLGDQDALSEAISLCKPAMAELPANFNWRRNLGPNPDALIIHYIASWKLEIVKSRQKGIEWKES